MNKEQRLSLQKKAAALIEGQKNTRISVAARDVYDLLAELERHENKLDLSHQRECQQRKLEAALKKSRDRFNRLTEHSRTVIWEANLDGLFTCVSPGSKEVYGYQPDELVGKKYLYDLIDEPERDFFKSTFLKHIQSGQIIRNLENPIRHKNGTRGWVLSNGLPLRNAEGELVGYQCSDQDITERKQAEEQLQSFTNDFYTFLDHTQDFIYFKDGQGYIRFCSQSMAEITGHNHWKELVGKHDWEIFPADAARRYEEEERVVYDGKSLIKNTQLYYDAQGNQGYVQTSK